MTDIPNRGEWRLTMVAVPRESNESKTTIATDATASDQIEPRPEMRSIDYATVFTRKRESVPTLAGSEWMTVISPNKAVIEEATAIEQLFEGVPFETGRRRLNDFLAQRAINNAGKAGAR